MVVCHRSEATSDICILFSVKLIIDTEALSAIHAIPHRRVSSLGILESMGSEWQGHRSKGTSGVPP